MPIEPIIEPFFEGWQGPEWVFQPVNPVVSTLPRDRSCAGRIWDEVLGPRQTLRLPKAERPRPGWAKRVQDDPRNLGV